jgi:hypothetical protein
MTALVTGAAIVAIAALTACSSVIEGTSQEIVVNTTPAGADCNLLRQGVSIAHVNPTPGTATIKKTKYDITIECSMPNFHKSTYFNKSDAAGATFGNIILGGGIGWAIDSASGADNKYTSPVNISMVPLTQAAPAPVYSSPPKSEEQSAEASSESK